MASFLHTCYRIGEIERSVAFYEKLGFEEVRRMPIGEEAINVFMALPGEDPRLELTYNHGVDSYDLGTGYGHIAFAVDSLDTEHARFKKEGLNPRDIVEFKRDGKLMARFFFVQDPDGYKIEILQKHGRYQ